MAWCDYVRARSDGWDAAMSLMQAIRDAGGDVSPAKFEGMTLLGFMTTIAAQNNIRFHYVRPDSDEPEIDPAMFSDFVGMVNG